MPSDTKEILDDSMDGQEASGLMCGFEPSHLSLS
jgi:hypothetical protein